MLTLLNAGYFPITDPTWIFFLVLVIILLAPIILERLHVPHIIGMILAGALIGEHGFHILERDSSFELFGEVGLFYIMFLAGLEMNMEDFKSIRVKATVLGVLAFLFPLCIGVWANLTLLEYGLMSGILLACLYASHTLVTYPIAIRYGLSKQHAVGIAVGGTAITDTLTLLVLAITAGSFRENTPNLFWVWLILKFIVAAIVITFLFPRVARWFFRRYSDPVLQYIFVLSMVFLGAGVMAFIGMEGILGAFLVGLLLNRLIPHVSPLMNHLEFVGNALFIPYFLIGIGMLINVTSLFNHLYALKVAGIMVAVSLVGKWLAAWATQKIFRMRKVERRLMYGLSNARAAATLAAVTVGYNIILPDGSRLLNEDVFNGAILLIIVSCTVSAFITENAARCLVTEEHEGQVTDEKEKRDERILISIYNPETIQGLMDIALMIRNPKQNKGLVALSVVNDSTASEAKELKARKDLEQTSRIASAAGTDIQTVLRYDINVAQGIIHAAKEHAITDLVIGLHRKTNIMDSFFGNLTESLLKGTHREVMIMKLLMPANTLRRIVVAVPMQAEYEVGFPKWVGQVCRLSKTLGCRVHFFATPQTLGFLRHLVEQQNANAEYTELDDWEDLLLLTGQVNYDHLFVVVSARKGSISYQPSFEKLPLQISRYFANNSLMVIYPDQLGDPQDLVSFSEPHQTVDSKAYETVSKYLYKWFKSES